jgi:SpoIID/LytB domain protein
MNKLRSLLRSFTLTAARVTPICRNPLAAAATLVLFATAITSASLANAQGVELSRADRLAILYTPQLQFAPGGEPLIKIGLVDGASTVRFEASTAVDILPLGPGGPEIQLPADTTFTVEIDEGTAGTYQHRVTVAELTPDQRSEVLGDVRAAWSARGYEVSTTEVGSIFAIAGRRFDTRKTLVVLPASESAEVAQELANALTLEFGIDARVHSELDDYPGCTLHMSGIPGGVRISHRDLLFVRGERDTVFTVYDVPYDVGTRNEGTETRRYHGALYFTADRNGRLALVNELPIEELLASVVASEIYASAPDDALRAQAVAARSELLTDLGVRHLADPWMTCSDQRCQVYRGISIQDSRTTAAVDATRGFVLTDGDQIIKAYYSSNNGGFAGSNSTTWGEAQRPYLRARLDAADGDERFANGLQDESALRTFLDDPPDSLSNISSFGSGRNFRWQVTLTAAELTTAVAARQDIGRVISLSVVERDFSGRVTRLQIDGTSGSVTVERELNVRRTLGGLRSALFAMDVRYGSDGNLSSVILNGAGFGHGVGLCQSGAIGAAERGWGWEDILANYYPDTTLRTLY